MKEADWKKEFEGYCGMGSEPSDRYYFPLPVWTGGNAFFNGAVPGDIEEDFYEDKEHDITLEVILNDDDWEFKTNLSEYLPLNLCKPITTDTLGMAFEPEQRFENPDGSDIAFDTDMHGNRRTGRCPAGPHV